MSRGNLFLVTASLTCLPLLLLGPLTAQEWIQEGDKIRIQSPSLGGEAIFLERVQGQLRLVKVGAEDETPRAIPLEEVESLERQVPRTRLRGMG